LLPEHYWLQPALAVPVIWGEISWPRQDEYFKVTVCGFENDLPVLKMLKNGTGTVTRSCSNNNRCAKILNLSSIFRIHYEI